MVEQATEAISKIRHRLRGIAIERTVGFAHRNQHFRHWILDRISHSLKESYESTETNMDLYRMEKWFGKSLVPFAERLVMERPRAAKAVARFIYQWAYDVKRRSEAAQTKGVVTPCTVVIEPTSRCNLNCPGCYAKSTRKGEDMSYELLEGTVQECADMGVTLITLSGGEPFMREKEEAVITRLAQRFPNLGFLVYTNSLCIDEDVADRLGEVGNVFPAISIEGNDDASDARRGSGYSKKTETIRRMLSEREVMYGCSVTATSQNIDYVVSDEFIDRRIADGDMFAWYFIMQPIGRNPDVSLMLNSDQREYMREQLFAMLAKGKPIFIGDFWNYGQIVDGCIAAGKYYFHIYANGDISPCVFAPVACGNMRDILSGKGEYKSLTEFVNNHPFFRAYREKQKEIKDHRAPCMLIDHPKKFREICQGTPWYPALNMPEGYLDGDIAKHIDYISEDWKAKMQISPRIPEAVSSSPWWEE